jgi:hypothetical protein
MFLFFPGAARFLRCSSDDFRYIRTVHVWVRMAGHEQDNTFLANHWGRTTAVHRPWLHPPRGVQLHAEDGTAMVRLPPVSESAADWDVALVRAGSGPGTAAPAIAAATLFQASFSTAEATAPGRFCIETARFGYNRTWAAGAVAGASGRGT